MMEDAFANVLQMQGHRVWSLELQAVLDSWWLMHSKYSSAKRNSKSSNLALAFETDLQNP